MGNDAQLRSEERQVVAEMRAVPGSHQSLCGAQALPEIRGEFSGSLPFPSEQMGQALLRLPREK
jgi:hypothetical protein